MTRRILLVEDDRITRLATRLTLEKLGYAVVEVGDGGEAVEAEATGKFAAVIMDCQLPNVDGYKATAEIRRRAEAEHRPRTPIIGLSARDMEGDRETAIARGMDAYLTKPLRLKALVRALEETTGAA